MSTLRFNYISGFIKTSSICLIALASSCSDDVADTLGQGDRFISFNVTANDTWSRSGNDAARNDAGTLSTVELNAGDSRLFLIPEVTPTVTGFSESSRGAAVSKSSLSSFSVYAATVGGNPDRYYMNNEEITKENSWTPQKEYLWPGDGSLHFNAFAPYCGEAVDETAGGITSLPSSNPADEPAITYTVPSDVTAQTDLMWATPVTASASPCQMTFNHALSAIRFVAGSEMTACTVKSITISGINGKGVFNLEDGNWSDVSTQASYTADLDVALTAPSGSYVTEGTAITDDAHTFMLIPQSLDENASVTLSIDYDGAEIDFTASLKGQAWTAGNTYTYHLSANPELDRFVITVDSPLKFNYTGGSQSYNVTSRHEKIVNGVLSTEEVPWIAEFVDANGNVIGQPSWITSIPLAGAKSMECEASTQMVDPDFVQMSEATRKLRQAAPVGSENSPYNLSNASGGTSVENTANCYVINAPGYYSIPLVYGNAIKDGADNTAAYLPTRTNTPFVNHLGNHITHPYIYDNTGCEPQDAVLVWEGRLNMIHDVRLSDDKKYLEFDITPAGIRQGNAVVAVRDKSGDIMWSWQLWITDYVLGQDLSTLTYNGTTFKMMPVNLGNVKGGDETDFASNDVLLRFTQKPVDGSEGSTVTISVVQSGKHVITPDCHSFYQWGRKDPMISGIKEWYNADHTEIMQISTRHIESLASGSIGNEYEVEQIKDPEVLWILSSSGNPKFKYSNQWNAGSSSRKVKTIYDPSPVGFVVPGSEILALEYLPDSDFSFQSYQGYGNPDGFIVKGTDDGTTLFFPALGYRSGKSGNETTHLNGNIITVLWTDHAAGNHQESNALLMENHTPLRHTVLSEARLEAFGIRCVTE